VDPSNANALFILGSKPFAGTPMDGTGSLILAFEARQAGEKYLALAEPDGPHSGDRGKIAWVAHGNTAESFKPPRRDQLTL
jgi:hypothetical protein